MRSYSVAVVAVISMSCGAVVVPPEERRDSGARDGGVEDAGHRDAGARTDGGSPDSGIGRDGGERDGALAWDAGERDAGPPRDGGPRSFQLTVVKPGPGPAVVLSDPPGIDCGAACSFSFREGTLIRLAASPDRKARIVEWSGPCSGQDDCAFSIDADTTVTLSVEIEPSLALGAGHACAVNHEGRLRCWGAGLAGRLGHDSEASVGAASSVSIQAAGDIIVGAPVLDVGAGTYNTCAITDTRALRCWGGNSFGQLGYGTVIDVSDDLGPTIVQAGDVPVGGLVRKVVGGFQHTCALLESGAVRCWGRASEGQLGYGNTTQVGDGVGPSISVAGDVPLGFSAIDLCAGRFHNCAVSTTGAVRCWGHGLEGQLGQGTVMVIGDGVGPSIDEAGDVPIGGPAVRAIECGATHTCATTTADTTRCWGAGASGQLGYNDTLNVADGGRTIGQVGAVPVGGAVARAYAGGAHSCALMVSGAVRCWGNGLHGRLGYDATEDVGDDVTRSIQLAGDVPIGVAAVRLSIGTGAHSCVITEFETVRCWGSGATGYGIDMNVGDGTGPSIVQAGDVVVW